MPDDFFTRLEQSGLTDPPRIASVTPINGGGVIPDADHPLVRGALDARLGELAAARQPGRNDALNAAAAYLGRFPIPRPQLREALLDACRANGLLAEDGEAACNKTIGSGFKKADADGPRILEDRGPNLRVVEVVETRTPPNEAAHHKPGTFDAIFEAESGFWESTDTLSSIYQTALHRGGSPWAVLAFCTARALTRLRPNITLPPLIGGPGSLNWFAALASPSGGGKGAAAAIARELLPVDIRERNLGSGEGMLAAYYKPGTKDTPPEVNEANMFIADEVDTVSALGARTGSTLMGVLRSAFSGETLGFTYKSGDHHIAGDEYRMTVIIAVQPQRAAAMLNDGGGGTPQRLMWFPATDTRIPMERDQKFWVTPLRLPALDTYPRVLSIPAEAEHMIWTQHVKRNRGEGDALDGHAMFCREKFAYGLTLLHGRRDMSLQDWELSGVAAEVSSRTRDWVAAEMRRGERVAAADRGRLMGVAAAEADDEKAYQSSRKTHRVARWALEKIKDNDGPMSQRDLARACASRDRGWLQGALESLAGSGLARREDDGRWVLS